MTTVNFSDVPMHKIFTHAGTQYIKDRQDRAQEYRTSKPRKQFSPSCQVEIDFQITARMANSDLATEKQIRYLVDLGVTEFPANMTKAQASMLIDAAKRGDGVGSFGGYYWDGSN